MADRPGADPISARRVALDVLDLVLSGQRPLEDVFGGHPRLGLLAGRDRAFARLLVATTLRRLGQIDAVLDRFLRQTPKSIQVRNLLRFGAAQLLFLHTPAHAAVAETVALASGRLAFARGLANAVLRRVAREGEGLLAKQDAPRLNTPDWLWNSWCEAYGEAAARAIAEAHLSEPPLDLTVKEYPEVWARRLDAGHLYGSTLRRATAGAIEDVPGYGEGVWWVQDAAAALPARLLPDVAGRTAIDLCAAPGGKTAQLAAAGAMVIAVEASAQRAERLGANLARLRLDAKVVIADARRWRPGHPVERLLLDAPCTATGTIRRHPDIVWHKTPADLVRLAGLQRQLLAAAVEMLLPGGVLVYASCSLQPGEGALLIDAVLADGLPLERVAIEPHELGGLAVDLTAAGDVRTLPYHLAAQGGLDGFFIARLRRRG
jgi:16S rRNA (cytosine967-C5)-methyltransferase